MAIAAPMTVSQLELLPEPLDGTRYELIEGEFEVTTQPSWKHQVTSTNVASLLREWSERTGAGLAMIAPGVVFSDTTAVAPDVVWISQERRSRVLGDDGRLYGAPDLAVEVLSPGPKNERRDRETKLALYSQQGVREYWLVDWQQRSLAAYRREQAALRLTATLYEADTLESPLLPSFSCLVSHLFSGVS
jgi:Uma2 family endonuclease